MDGVKEGESKSNVNRALGEEGKCQTKVGPIIPWVMAHFVGDLGREDGLIIGKEAAGIKIKWLFLLVIPEPRSNHPVGLITI